MLSSLRARLIFFFLLPTLLFFAVAGAASWLLSREILEDELGKSLSAIAAAAASQVRGSLLLEIAPGDDLGEGTLTFKNVSRRLNDVQEATKAQRLFAFDLEGRMRVDTAMTLPVGADIPELERDRQEVALALSGQATSSQVLFIGKDGRTYKTGYAPIRKDGVVVGAVAVEGSAEFFGPLQTLSRTFWLWGLFCVGILLLLSLWVSHSVSTPLQRLAQSAGRIQRGDLTTAVPPENMKEIGMLAQGLEEMRAALQRRDEQLKMMLAGVAHEVRNPMGGIELFAGLLSESLTDDEAKGHLSRIQKETAYLKRIVDEFLAFSKDEKRVLEVVSAADWVQNTVELLAADAQAKKVSVVVQAAPFQLEIDATLMTSALLNVLKNAISASPEGGTVEIQGVVTPQCYRIDITDCGPGIASDIAKNIFEPFFTTKAKGTGLGLPLALKWVKVHGGTLTFDSKPGKTVFRFELLARQTSASGRL